MQTPRQEQTITRSFSAILAISLAGLQFFAVLAVVTSSYVTSERALIRHARDLLTDVAVNTTEHSKGFLSPAQGAAELAARLAQSRVVASDDPQILEKLLFQQLQITPQFAGIYYGGEDGSFVYVMRTPGGAGPIRSKIITVTEGLRSTELIWRDDDFHVRQRSSDPQDRFDPRDRPWYLRARQARTTIWTDPYIFFSSQQPGITLAAPVLTEQGQIRGVVGVDIEISMISNFLARLTIGTHGKALIMNHNGDVIAHPDIDLLRMRDQDGTLRFASILELEDPIARAAFSPLMKDGALRAVQEMPAQFVYKGESYVSALMQLNSDALPWTIAVYAPENDFTAVIKRNRRSNLWIAAGVAVVTGLIGLALALRLSRPLRDFADRSALIATGQLDASAGPAETYSELESAGQTLIQATEARREAEREYGMTFDLSSRGMAQVMPGTGRVIRANKALCDITGYSADEMAELTLSDLADPEEPAFDPLDSAQTPTNVINQQMRWRCRDGRVIWVNINAIMIHDRTGTPLHAVVTVDDISEAREKEREILRLNRDLSHIARGNTMGQMASGLAHELNQPLTAIAQNADSAVLLLNRSAAPQPEVRALLDQIMRQSMRAGEIIHALRAFIRKDQGESGPVSLPDLLEQTMQLCQVEIAEAGVTVETQLEPDLPPVLGNRVQIAQVVVNLLRNAIEAIAGAGLPAPDRRVTVQARRAGAMVTVTIADTGPGVAPGQALFTRFETGKPGGMGLGLSICRTIITAHGGALWHEPVQPHGARFRFTLRICQPAGADPAAET